MILFVAKNQQLIVEGIMNKAKDIKVLILFINY